jgi:hypothetical protein
LSLLGRFVEGKVPDNAEMLGLNFSVKDAAGSLASLYCRAEAEELAGGLAGDIADGRADAGDARNMVLDCLTARYTPSSAIATISIWTGAYA